MRRIAFVIILVTATIVNSYNLNAHIKQKDPQQNKCSTYSIIGAIQVTFKLGLGIGQSCEITCPTNTAPHCKSGFASVDCHCDISGQCPSSSRGNIPNLDEDEIQMITDFKNWCIQYGTAGMIQIGNDGNNVLSAISNNNTSAFDSAENSFDQHYEGLSDQERDAIDSWIDNYSL